MYWFVRAFGLLLLAYAFLVPVFSTAQEKKADDPKKSAASDDPKKSSDDAPEPKAKPKAKEKLKPDWGAAIVGKLTDLRTKDDKVDTFTVQVVDDQERLLSLSKADFREYTILKTSTMPSFKDKLNAQEMADLLAYLVSLKGR